MGVSHNALWQFLLKRPGSADRSGVKMTYTFLYNFEPGFSDISDIKFPKNFLFLDFIAKMSPGNGKTSCGCHHHKIANVRGCSHRLERCNGPGHPGTIRPQYTIQKVSTLLWPSVLCIVYGSLTKCTFINLMAMV